MEIDFAANTVNAIELEKLIHAQLDLLSEQPRLARKLPPLMIWGAPGLGKSTIVRKICVERGIELVDVRLAQRDPVDIRGLPVPRDNGVEWLVSAEWPRDPASSGIILFDELTAADRTLQVAAYEFILDRKLGTLYRVPDQWYIMGAGNRLEDSAVAIPMSSALANRFLHVELAPDVEAWLHWAARNDIHPLVTGFLRYRPGLLFAVEKQTLQRGWPSPRSWERVSIMLRVLGGENEEGLLGKSVAGLVGTGAAAEFMAFRKMAESLDDIHALLLDSSLVFRVPTKADQKFAVVSAMVYWVWRGKDEAEAAKLLDGFYRLSLKLPSDFAAMAMIDAIQGGDSDEYADKLYRHRAYPSWAAQHGTAFRTRMGAMQ